ncbi:MAG TPA: mechanosensitive ion channel domain-containing protein [Acidobacteriota bacterium]|nr:mechanosensitive ion channel domain-containing protein [Acidobacteriota bacterium]
MQEWIQSIQSVGNFQLFTVSGNQITVGGLAVFLLTLVLTVFLGSFVKGLIRRRFSKIDEGPRYTLARLSQYVVWVVGLMVGLQALGIELTALMVVAGTLGIGIGFGLQDVVADFVSGLVLLLERPVRVNDYITTEDDVRGRVDSINFRVTRVLTNDNIAVIVPNSDLTDDAVINWSHRDERVRLRVPVGVAYGSDTSQVKDILLEVAEQNEEVLAQPQPQVRFAEFGDSSLNFQLHAWTDQPSGHFRITSDLNFAIDEAFRQADIEIPFPQRDLHIRTSDGLKPLREVIADQPQQA